MHVFCVIYVTRIVLVKLTIKKLTFFVADTTWKYNFIFKTNSSPLIKYYNTEIIPVILFVYHVCNISNNV